MAKNDPVEMLLTSLAEANEETLARIDQRIAAKQAEIDQATDKLWKEMAGLVQLKKLIDGQVHGKKSRRGGRKNKVQEATKPLCAKTLPGGEGLRERLKALLKEKPGMILREISRELNEHHLRVLKALQDELFTETTEGWELR